MLGISQLQFPSRDSGKIRFFSYLGTFVSLSILLNPVSICFMGATLLFRSEIKAFYVYKEMKAAKQQKVSKREYWEIFFKNNITKVVYFCLLSAGMMYFSFTSTFLLVASFGAIPLTMLLILLQSELRPKDFNPLTLFKAAMDFFVEGIKENSRSLVNGLDARFEHLLPHMLNDETIKNIKLLAEKYGEKIPEYKDVINSGEFINFIEYIKDIEDPRVLKDDAKNKLILFLKDFCENDQKHSSGFTGGQILLLVLRACNDGEGEVIVNKRDALIVNLLDTQTFSTKERIPNTCFTGIIYRMLSSLEGMHFDPEIKFTPPRRMFLEEAKNQASRFMLDVLKKKKNNKEIFHAWYQVQNDPDSQKIVDDFIAEVRVPLMRELLGFGSVYTEQIVLMLMNSIGSIRLKRIEGTILLCVEGELKKHGLDNLYDNQVENIANKVFLALLDKDLLNTDFSLKNLFIRKEEYMIISEIVEREAERLKLEPKKTMEGQVVRMLNNLNRLPQSRRCYRIYEELGKNDEDKKREVKRILHERLKLPEKTINALLKEESLSKLELAIEDIYHQSKNNVVELYNKIKEVKREFTEDELLTAEEIDSIVKGKIVNLSTEDKLVLSKGRLSRCSSVSNMASGYDL